MPNPTPADPALDLTIDPKRLPDDVWQAVLQPLELRILRRAATEPPGSGRYLHHDAPGAYHCVGCGQRLYDAAHKFHAGCGWPSFFQEVQPGAVKTYRDISHGMVRVEMRCARCDGHLGHIFPDAPQTPTGNRHCVNGFALLFVPNGQDPRAVFEAHRAAKAAR